MTSQNILHFYSLQTFSLLCQLDFPGMCHYNHIINICQVLICIAEITEAEWRDKVSKTLKRHQEEYSLKVNI